MAFLIRKTLEMKFRLRKIQESLQEHHGTIKLAQFQEEFDYSFNAEDQKDGEKWGLEKSSPIKGKVDHTMKWVLEDKLVYLMGFGWNYTENFQADARFTGLKILIAKFEDTSNISNFIKFKT